MITREKRKALVGVPLGIVLFIGPLVYLWVERHPLGWPGAICMFGGLAIYLWGCLALARAKGYSGALLLTVVLGYIFPAVILLALPDKHPKSRVRRRPPSNEAARTGKA